MSCRLFLCGPDVAALRARLDPLVAALRRRGAPAALVETQHDDEDAGRARVVGDGPLATGVAILLVSEPRAPVREAAIARAPTAVVVAWGDEGVAGFEPVADPHLRVRGASDVDEALAAVVALLEGLGYVGAPVRGALTDDEDAALLQDLKDLGYA